MKTLTTRAPRNERNRQVLGVLSNKLEAINADMLDLERELAEQLTDYACTEGARAI